MSMQLIGTRYVTKCVCDFCGHIQDEISPPTEHAGEEIPDTCPMCGIGEMQYEQLPIEEYHDTDDDIEEDED